MNLFDAPTIEYCEKPMQGLIRRPYYALSNLAFLITGLVIIQKGKGDRLSKVFGFTAIMIGLFSFTYDASYLYISQLIDLSGMFLFVNILLNLNLGKILKSSKRLVLLQSLAFLAFMTIIVLFRGFAGDVVFGLYVLAVMASEYLLYKRKIHTNHRVWIMAFAVFVTGFGFWLLDASKTLCFSFGLLNGRAIFHYLNAISIYYLYVFYENNTSKG